MSFWNSYRQRKMSQTAVTSVAILLVALFAAWWFLPSHLPHNFSGNYFFLNILLFALVSYVVWHSILMEVLTWSIASHIKDTREQKPAHGLKVAFITTIVPANESVELLHKCLPAMVKADYPHDTWVLDEGNSDEVKKICEQYGVFYFTRFKSRLYNAKKGTFAKKTKGGNHNAWYAKYGHSYDVVAQIDTDFIPKKAFLTKTLGYFKDPKVAFVGTPQVYGNIKDSYIARGAAEQQYSFYGSVLRGLSGMNTTLLIGANHVIRVSALKSVNLYSAHITEDLLTGMKLHNKGWKSIYVPYPLAIGEGPTTWEAYFNQQMRWAYGCIDILFRHSPRLFFRLGFRRTLYYFFLQQHYFSGLAMASSLLLLSLYFFGGIQAATIDSRLFFLFYSGVLLVCWLMSVYMQRFDLHSDKKSELLLAGKLISIAAWPIYFIALLSVILRKRLHYKITPKGINDPVRISPRVFIPHTLFFLIAISGLLSSVITHRQNPVMLFWAGSAAILMLAIPFIEQLHQLTEKLVRVIKILMEKLDDTASPSPLNQPISLGTPLQGMKGGLAVHSIPAYSVKKSLNQTLLDSVFISLVTLLSVSMYLSKIGFYSDDWSFLGNFTLSHNKSIIGLILTATTPNTLMRPMQNVLDAVLFWLFGYQPLGYQLVNTGVMVITAVLFYLVLTKLKLPRIIAVAVPLLYTLLPTYSTDKFWYAAFQTNTSMLFYFLSLYLGILAVAKRTTHSFLYKTLSLLSLVLCGLSYEVVLPLTLINGLIFWQINENNQAKSQQKRYSDHKAFIVLTFITMLYLLLFKAMTTTRLGNLQIPKDPVTTLVTAIKVNYVTQIITIPSTLANLVAQYTDKTTIIAAFILFPLLYIYLYSLISSEKERLPAARWMRIITLLGFATFLLGYAIFLTNNAVGFSPTGVENRVAIASAIGLSFSLLGFGGWLIKQLLPEFLAKIAYCLVIALLCSVGFVILNTLALFWSQAYQTSNSLMTQLHTHFKTLPHHTAIILDGVCPYIGPATVFESEYDVKGALQVLYHDPTLRGDIVSSRLQIKNDGFHTNFYAFTATYPYKNLYIYNAAKNRLYPITSKADADAYFAVNNPDYQNACPPGEPGNGVSVY